MKNVEEMRHVPLGTVFTDEAGDVWMIDTWNNGELMLFGPETGRMPASHVIKKWGPLTMQWCPQKLVGLDMSEVDVRYAEK